MKSNNDNVDWLFNKATGIILKQHREEANLSLEDVARKMKTPISRQSLFKYENNLARIKNNTFIEICNVLKIDPDKTFSEISTATYRYKYYMDNGYEVSYPDKNGNLKIIDLYDSVSSQENSDEIDTSNNINSEFDFMAQYKSLFDKDDRLTEDQKKFFMNFLEEKHKKVDENLDKN